MVMPVSGSGSGSGASPKKVELVLEFTHVEYFGDPPGKPRCVLLDHCCTPPEPPASGSGSGSGSGGGSGGAGGGVCDDLNYGWRVDGGDTIPCDPGTPADPGTPPCWFIRQQLGWVQGLGPGGGAIQFGSVTNWLNVQASLTDCTAPGVADCFACVLAHPFGDHVSGTLRAHWQAYQTINAAHSNAVCLGVGDNVPEEDLGDGTFEEWEFRGRILGKVECRVAVDCDKLCPGFFDQILSGLSGSGDFGSGGGTGALPVGRQ